MRLPTEAHLTSAWWKRFITSGRSPFLLGHSYVSTQYRFLIFWPTHFAVGANSSQIVFLLDLSYQLFRQVCSTSVQYSPSTSFMSAGHAEGFFGPAPAASSTT